MLKQELQLSGIEITTPPEKRYLVKRINGDDIEITQTERNHIAGQLDKVKAVQIGEYTVMISNIQSIDPKYGASNVPPRPEPVYDKNLAYETNYAGVKCWRDENMNLIPIKPTNQQEIDQWDKWYKIKQLEKAK